MIFDLKTIRFIGRQCSIVCQNENGPCPLIALANALILENRITIHSDRSRIRLEELVELVANVYVEASHRKSSQQSGESASSRQQQLDEVLTMLPSLAKGLDLNVKFSGVTDFEFTREMNLFDAVGYNVLHGWVVDRQDARVSAVVLPLSYNHLVYQLVEYRSLLDNKARSMLSESATALPTRPHAPAPLGAAASVSAPVSSVGYSPLPDEDERMNPLHSLPVHQPSRVPIPSPSISQPLPHPSSSSAPPSSTSSVALTVEEQRLLETGQICEEFMSSSASQLTYAGLLGLYDFVRERQVSVFFRNNHFCTMYRHDGHLHLLVTDQGYVHEPSVVWELLDEIDGATEYLDADFRIPNRSASAVPPTPTVTMPVSAPPLVPLATSANIEMGVPMVMPVASQPPAAVGHDEDLHLAMMLQAQEQQLQMERVLRLQAEEEAVRRMLLDEQAARDLQQQEDLQQQRQPARPPPQPQGRWRPGVLGQPAPATVPPPPPNSVDAQAREFERIRQERVQQRHQQQRARPAVVPAQSQDSNCSLM